VKDTIDAVGKHHLHVPAWIPISCYTAISVGTMMGGWRIVKTMGTKITKVTPVEGLLLKQLVQSLCLLYLKEWVFR